MNKYRFSPSTLDKFQHLIDADAYFESDFNFTDDGPKASLEEIRAAREQELLDAINKVPQPPIEAAARGTAFNELVDQAIKAKYYEVSAKDNYDKTKRVNVMYADEKEVAATCEGFVFDFKRELVEQIADTVCDGTMQLHVGAPLQIDAETVVLLHGYPDYIQPRKVTDLKTTESYVFGKYERYWQRYVYPYILQKTGFMQVCDAFEFLVVEFTKPKKNEPLNGTIARETYTDVSVKTCEENLRWICGALIDWIEAHRNQITNPKIFEFEL